KRSAQPNSDLREILQSHHSDTRRAAKRKEYRTNKKVRKSPFFERRFQAVSALARFFPRCSRRESPARRSSLLCFRPYEIYPLFNFSETENQSFVRSRYSS